MKRHLNYTNRVRIPRERVSVLLDSSDGARQEVQIALDLRDLQVPPDARVYVEAYCHGDQIRFDLGTVSHVPPHAKHPLARLSNSPNVRFRVLVVDETDTAGRILAAADGLRAIRPGEGLDNRRGILPVDDTRDLGQEVWRLEYGDEVTLLLNRRVPDVRQRLMNDDTFRLAVFPTLLREILLRLCLVGDVASGDDGNYSEDGQDWRTDWHEFFASLVEADRLNADNRSDPEEVWRLADAVAAAYADTRTGEFRRLLRMEEGE